MTDDTQGQLQYWQQLKQQAVAGDLRMEEGIGEALRVACSNYLGKLERLKLDAGQLEYLSGYGGLPSAKDMQAKFQRKATGGGGHDPDDSAVKRLEQHIQIAQLMHDTYAAAIGRLSATDAGTAGQMTSTGEGLN
ncbi:hypothetical protein B0T36_22930 [Nocardia donostiensis]|uniref:hypothetical protein n=1 Tax=Nocardia donostiensis TaxID=1538463 RepID=UPI0009DAD197|nr:hypothetical protein [Nocardia donostiensis]OQS12844.1 hypothetical protein B0T36_22930 [Nocardia donostiensis]